EAPASGVLGRTVAAVNTELPVGALLGLIGEPGDSFPVPEAAAPAAAATGPASPASAAAAPAPAGAPTSAAVVPASPAARRLARAEELLPGFEAASGIRLTYTVLLVETVAHLLGEHPMLNAALVEDSILVSDAVHMGVAVALEDGLIVPVIRDAHSKSLLDLA